MTLDEFCAWYRVEVAAEPLEMAVDPVPGNVWRCRLRWWDRGWAGQYTTAWMAAAAERDPIAPTALEVLHSIGEAVTLRARYPSEASYQQARGYIASPTLSRLYALYVREALGIARAMGRAMFQDYTQALGEEEQR